MLLVAAVALFALVVLVTKGLSTPAAKHGGREEGAGAAVQLAPPDWHTYLLLGLDQRDDEPPRSDTVMLVNWDKANNRANVLSLPRDLWVDVPGYGKEKLSSAYALGEGANGPGGAALIKRTLKENLGLEIEGHAAVTLEGFESIVDRLGGVWLDVPFPLADDEYPNKEGGYERLYIEAGLQHMDGERALKYARSRHADGDFGRVQRQQQVLTALRERVTRFGSATKIPGLISELRSQVETDLSTPELLKLAPAALRLHGDGIRGASVGYDLLEPTTTGSGVSILIPHGNNWTRLRKEVRRMLEGSTGKTQ